jgi:SAM-dependent methyltransferase
VEAAVIKLGELTPAQRRARRRYSEGEREFDRLHNVDTAGRIDLANLPIGSGNWLYGNCYQAVNAGEFRQVVEAAGIHCQEFVFVDLGSGKGRALLLASEYSFQKVIGVEFSKDLVDIARKNIQGYQSTTQHWRNIDVVHADAAEFALPDESVVLFLYNPFDRHVMAKVVENARRSWESRPREMVVLYVTPDLAEICAYLSDRPLRAKSSPRRPNIPGGDWKRLLTKLYTSIGLVNRC